MHSLGRRQKAPRATAKFFQRKKMNEKNYIQPLATAYIAMMMTMFMVIFLVLVDQPALIIIGGAVMGIILSAIMLWFYWPRGE